MVERAGPDTLGRNAREVLAQESRRIESGDPFQILGVGYDATAAEIRAAFLAATKRLHPHRFARHPEDIRRLANEVFLSVKRAYEDVSDDDRRVRVAAMVAPAAPVGATAERPPTPRPRRQPDRTPPDRRPATPPRRATTARPPSSRRGVPRSRASVPPPNAHESAGSERRVRRPPTASREAVNAIQDTVRQREEMFEAALKLCYSGRYNAARTAFQQIAVEDPKTKKYRVQMHYAWGLEHEAAGRFDEARAEYMRAIKLDPEFKRAHEAIAKLPQPDQKKSGLFSKLFGR